MNRLSDDLFEKLYGFLEYCLKQREDEVKRIEMMNEIKKDILKSEEPKNDPELNN